MKKIIVGICMSLFMLVVGVFSGCGKKDIKYYIDYDSINNVVAYNSEISFDDIFITKAVGVEESRISINKNMIISCDSTDSVGEKELVVKYKGKKYVIDFIVKYKVDFIVENIVYNSQYVLSADEIEIPLTPEKNGLEFVSWDPNLPQNIDNNMTIYAQFTVASTGMQELMPYYSATYLDTLANINLPKNENGEWVFVDDLSTKVGNVGDNHFQVKFIPNDSNLLPSETRDLIIKVAKKELTFKNVTTSFMYDGKAKRPEYELDVADLEVNYIPYYSSDAILNGEYEYEMEIVDENYCGSYYGSFTIEKVKTTIVIENKTINFSDDYPLNYVYNVLDANQNTLDSKLIELMEIEIIKPIYQHAGLYEINANVKNENFDVTINKGYLIVNKIEHDLEGNGPVFEFGYNITYSSKLESLVFINTDVRGVWSWKNPEIIVNKTGVFSAIAVFTPNEALDYLPSEKEIELNVTKKTLTIEILQNEYTYDKEEHSIVYQLKDVMEGEEESVEIVGNINKINAGEYKVNLSVSSDDLRYNASTDTTLKINQASKSDFSKIYKTEWSRALILNDVKLDEGFAWENPMEQIDYIGTRKFYAIFTPDDTINYKTEKGEVSLTLTKAKSSITTLEKYEFTYNKNGYTLYSINTSHNESELSYSYSYEGQEVEKLNNAGNYIVTLRLSESEHYLEATKSFNVIINKIENTDVIAENVNATYGETLSMYKLPISTIGTWVWKDGDGAYVGNAGSCVNIAEFTPSDSLNYNSRVVNVNFNIAKKVVEKPTINAKQFVEGQKLIADVTATDEYIIFKNEGGENVGIYEVILELVDPENYRWSDAEESAQTTIKFEITNNESNVWIEGPTINSFVYGQDTLKYTKGKTKFGNKNLSVIFMDKTTKNVISEPSNVGEYLAKFYVEKTENYNGLEKVLEFSIKHNQVDVPQVEDLTYDGTEISPSIVESEYYTIVSNESHIDVGVYEVVLELINTNYKWIDGTVGLQKIIEYRINKANDNSWETAPSISNWTYTPYGGEKGVAVSKYGTPVIEYKSKTAEDSEYSTELPKNVGTYVAKFVVEDNNNHNGLEQTVEFIIYQATPTFNAPTYDMTKAYFENEVDVSKCYLTAPGIDKVVLDEAGNNFTYEKPVLLTTTVDSSRTFEQVTFEVKYNSASKNYASVTATATINLYKVAYISKTYYGSIENALSNAVSKNSVYVIPNSTGNVKIVSDVKIESGVTLILPYIDYDGNITINTSEKATLNGVKNSNAEEFAHAYKYLNLTNLVYVNDNVTIENYGTIKIGGEISGGGYFEDKTTAASGIAGHTARNYAKLLLGSNTKIVLKDGSVTNVYGFIDEEIKNNGSQLIVEDGAELHVPFVVNDFRGGTYMKGMNDDSNKVSPFNQFEFRNVIPEVRVNYGGMIIAHSNVYAATLSTMYHTEVKMVGDTSKYAVQLKENAYMIVKYDIDESTRISGTDKWEDGIVRIKIYGGANGNPIALKISVGITSVTLDTSTSTFALSWRFNISMYDGEYNMSYKYKLLPGAVMFVDKSAKLTLDKFTVYEEFNDQLSKNDYSGAVASNYGYGKNLSAAQLIVNGHLVVSELGGIVTTQNDDAIIEVTTPKCLSYESKAGIVEKKVISKTYKVTEYYSTGETLKLVYQKDNTTLSEVTVTEGGKYVSSNNTWALA